MNLTSVSIIAGSKSDETAVKTIEEILKNANIDSNTAYLSAHRNKKELENYVTNSYASYFIAVAGLAAALPGSIAADTDKPVIAVPLWGGSTSSPCGLDALLAAVQMPPPKDGKNVALGAVAIDHPEYAANFVLRAIRARKVDEEVDVCILPRDYTVPSEKMHEKLVENLDKLGLSHSIVSKTAGSEQIKKEFKAKVYIAFSDAGWRTENWIDGCLSNRPVINVPILNDSYVNTFKHVKDSHTPNPDISDSYHLKYLFNFPPKAPAVTVGFNRMDNAAYLANKLIKVKG
jgi:5-(carboxyamino)imidazole ribonucleotide mutase